MSKSNIPQKLPKGWRRLKKMLMMRNAMPDSEAYCTTNSEKRNVAEGGHVNVSVTKYVPMLICTEDCQQKFRDVYDHCDFSFKPPMRSMSMDWNRAPLSFS